MDDLNTFIRRVINSECFFSLQLGTFVKEILIWLWIYKVSVQFLYMFHVFFQSSELVAVFLFKTFSTLSQEALHRKSLIFKNWNRKCSNFYTKKQLTEKKFVKIIEHECRRFFTGSEWFDSFFLWKDFGFQHCQWMAYLHQALK